jgi:hypothetical protein
VNDVTTNAPWPFLDKGGSADFRTGEFIEGGLNLTNLGLDKECFSSFIAETRSSTSVNAVLKDFVGGQFAVCNATMTTAPSVGAGATVLPGTSVTDIATVVGSNPAQTPSGTVTFFLCGPTDPSSTAVCSTGGSPAGTGTLSGSGGTASATSAPAVAPTAPGRYCFRAEWPGDTNYTTPLTHAGTGNSECFIVQDTSTTTTAQKWLPQDTATVTTTGGSAVSGTVTFSLYLNGTCTGPAARTFTDSSAPFETNNTTYETSSTTISWTATFVSDNGVVGSTSGCEVSTLTITN